MPTYWLYQWLDEMEIRTEWELNNVLRDRAHFKRLAELHEADAEANVRSIPISNSIVAGRSLDLSGSIDCGGYPCLRRDVDVAFLRMWHYFDGIVIASIEHRTTREAAQNDGDAYIAQTFLMDHLRILLYLRSVNADQWVTFVDKDQGFIEDDWRPLARSLNVLDAFEGRRHEQIVKSIAKNTHFQVSRLRQGVWQVRLTGGYFTEPQRVTFSQRERPTIDDLSRRILANFGRAALEDVATAEQLGLPLAHPTTVPWISSRKHVPTQEEVAIQLHLPVLSDLNVADFLKLREDERPAFEKFRKGLRDQIRSQLAAAGKGDTAARIAQNVEDDYLRPGLAEIEQKLRGSRKALVKKSAVSLGIGTSVAVVGAISSVPMMIAGSVVALGSAIPLAPLIGSYLDETNKEMPMSELYFLWRLKKKGKHWEKHR